MQHINLADARLLPPQPLVRGAALLALVGAAWVAAIGHGAVERQRLAAAVRADVAPADGSAPAPSLTDDAALAELRLRVAKGRALLDAADHAADALPNAAGILEQLLAAVPETMWLTELDLHGARGLRIAGAVLDAAALGPFADRLKQVPTLRGAPVETVRVDFASATSPTEGDGAAAMPAHHRFVIASAGAETAR
jgi:hypothetical protein